MCWAESTLVGPDLEVRSYFLCQVLKRGEKIELLVDKTDNLNQQSIRFKKHSSQLRQAMWWQVPSSVSHPCHHTVRERERRVRARARTHEGRKVLMYRTDGCNKSPTDATDNQCDRHKYTNKSCSRQTSTPLLCLLTLPFVFGNSRAECQGDHLHRGDCGCGDRDYDLVHGPQAVSYNMVRSTSAWSILQVVRWTVGQAMGSGIGLLDKRWALVHWSVGRSFRLGGIMSDPLVRWTGNEVRSK